MTSLNIVDLITNNPITKLSDTHNNSLLNKVKNTFNESQQQLFIASFYSYLNYDKTDDYIVDLDNIWKWLGFNKKFNGIRLLEKFFVLNKDYKNSLDVSIEQKFAPHHGGAKTKGSGGHNIQKYYLNIKTFKSLCLKAQTKKADEIHEYYIKLEELIQEVLEEEATEMKNKLLIKDTEIAEKEMAIKNADQDKFKAIEKTLVSQFTVNTECVYFGTIDNTNDKQEKLIKFGHSNNLPHRVQDHHKTYNNFILRDVFKVHNRQEIENLIKASTKIKGHLRTIEVDGKNRTEILAYDTTYFTIARLTKYIKDIISEKTYNIENFNKLIRENQNMKIEIERLNQENHDLKLNCQEYSEKFAKMQESLNLLNEKLVNNDYNGNNNDNYGNNNDNDNEKKDNNNHEEKDRLEIRFDQFIKECCLVRSDVEVDSCDIIAQFRIWNRVKPKRETNERFNRYLRTRFLACRLKNQTKQQNVHGFKGVMLKPIEYKKTKINDLIETFIFECCHFSPNNRIASNKLYQEFVNYKNKIGLSLDSSDEKQLKKYLNECPYVLRGTLHIQGADCTQEGYYGLALKTDNPLIRKIGEVSGKQVKKIDWTTGTILNQWPTIAKAALNENMSASKMSRNIKNNIVLNYDESIDENFTAYYYIND